MGSSRIVNHVLVLCTISIVASVRSVCKLRTLFDEAVARFRIASIPVGYPRPFITNLRMSNFAVLLDLRARENVLTG